MREASAARLLRAGRGTRRPQSEDGAEDVDGEGLDAGAGALVVGFAAASSFLSLFWSGFLPSAADGDFSDSSAFFRASDG